VTARAAPAHYRVVNTLRAWGVNVDETYFLGGVDKTAVLRAFGAHIFFDDQLAHAERAAATVPAAQVLWAEADLPPTEAHAARAVVPGQGRDKDKGRAKDKGGDKAKARGRKPATPRAAKRPAAPRARARSGR
jgi:sugar (pentulose or hexulose) kinase